MSFAKALIEQGFRSDLFLAKDNGKNADFGAPVLRNFLLPHRHGLIRVMDQFVLYLFQKTLHSAFLDGSKRHSVTTRSTSIALRHLVGLLKGLHLADMNV